MTTLPAAHPLAGGVELLERAVGFTLGGLTAVTAELIDAPTPCGDWTVQRLMDHVNDGLLALGEAFDDGAVRVDADLAERCPVAVLRTSATSLLGVLSTGDERPLVSVGGCPMTAEMIAAAGALEFAVHGWDLAKACGRPRPIPDGLAVSLLRLAPMLVADDDRPGRFAPPVPVPAGTPPGDRLVAWLGRTP